MSRKVSTTNQIVINDTSDSPSKPPLRVSGVLSCLNNTFHIKVTSEDSRLFLDDNPYFNLLEWGKERRGKCVSSDHINGRMSTLEGETIQRLSGAVFAGEGLTRFRKESSQPPRLVPDTSR
jgi:hypothetical protein